MPVPRPLLVSEAEFLALPETNEKIELLDGEVVMSPSPSVRHQVLVQRLMSALLAWSATRPSRPFIGQAPLDVRFGKDRILQPDLFIVLGGISIDHEGPIDVVPEICIEVLSGNRVHDRVTKRLIYAAAGVAELWVVEPAGPIERWSGAALDEVEEASETLRTPILGDFELALGPIFAAGP